MIGPGTGVRVYLACGVTDMRKGISGLAMLAQVVLRQQATSGAVFAFRGRRGDRMKLLHWDGQGFCLYYKILERGRFPWPIPTKRNRLVQLPVDAAIYALRNMVERCFNKLKNARRLATRYDKTADSYLGFIHIVSIRLWMRQFVNAS